MKRDHEAQQVQHQRQHPYKGYRRDVRGHAACDGHQHPHTAGRQHHPKCPGADAHRLRLRCGRGSRCGRLEPQAARSQSRKREQAVARGPRPSLGFTSDPWLKRKWVSKQRQNRADIAQRIQAVDPRPLAQPGLHQRCRGRQRHKRHADYTRQQQQNRLRRRAVRCYGPGDHRQKCQPGKQQQTLNDRLHAFWKPHQAVRVGVTREQRRLKEQQCNGPHGRRAAPGGQDETPDQRLHKKQQERRQQNRCRVDEHVARLHRSGPAREGEGVRAHNHHIAELQRDRFSDAGTVDDCAVAAAFVHYLE